MGVSSAAVVQATATSFGIGAIIVSSQPIFLTLKWLGVAYLAWLGLQSLRSARRGAPVPDVAAAGSGRARGFRQGFLCNITNPKMFAFFLALLPQFVAPDAPVTVWLAHALMLPLLGLMWPAAVAAMVATVRTYLVRRTVRRALDATAGVILLGFGLRLATDSARA
ncbi:LysE family translocator [Millisia brevis]|uniref:LysE family translocator n=1 Tax=Millisia brevis TaxID=264148 RepID=UPI00083032D1|nr:LysE family translocator [Millisia brevis]